jgi:tetratricopeptide (TPR) repeat protein
VAALPKNQAETLSPERVDQCIRSAQPETDAGWEYTVQEADLLTTAYNTTSDKTYLYQVIAVYESLRRKWPKNSSVWNNLAYLLAQNDERLAEVLECVGTAAAQDPDAADYLDTYGYLLYRKARYVQAAQSLVLAVRKYEGDPKRGLPRWGTQVWGMAPAEVYEHLGLVREATGDRGVRPWRPAVVRWMREGPPCPRSRSNGSRRRSDD